MISIDIPGQEQLHIKHIVLDYNGTLAKDGIPLPGVKEKLNLLSIHINVHILTADTFGKCADACRGINAAVQILKQPVGTEEKEKFVADLGAENVAAVGNGANDRLMLARVPGYRDTGSGRSRGKNAAVCRCGGKGY